MKIKVLQKKILEKKVLRNMILEINFPEMIFLLKGMKERLEKVMET